MSTDNAASRDDSKPREDGAPGNDIEITPEMIAAGVKVLLSYDQNFPVPELALREALSAVYAASRKRVR